MSPLTILQSCHATEIEARKGPGMSEMLDRYRRRKAMPNAAAATRTTSRNIMSHAPQESMVEVERSKKKNLALGRGMSQCRAKATACRLVEEPRRLVLAAAVCGTAAQLPPAWGRYKKSSACWLTPGIVGEGHEEVAIILGCEPIVITAFGLRSCDRLPLHRMRNYTRKPRSVPTLRCTLCHIFSFNNSRLNLRFGIPPESRRCPVELLVMTSA
jgi:hypothetical protein